MEAALDLGIDGRIYPVGSEPAARASAELDFMDEWYPIQVKQTEKIGRPDVDAFEAAMMRSKRKRGFMVGFGFTEDALPEIGGFFRREGISIVALTVGEILEETVGNRVV